MDHEQLSQATYQLDSRAEKDAKSLERQRREEARKEERFEPFKELQARNLAVFNGASNIIDAYPEKTSRDHETSTTRVIIGDIVPGNQGRPIIAQLTRWNRDDPYGRCRNIRFEFYRARKPAYAQEIGNNPENYSYLSAAHAAHFEKLKDRDEKTFMIGRNNDEIAKRAHERISGRAFSPLMAQDRATERGRISNRLDALEVTIKMIDEAARNPELNPVLAHALLGAVPQLERGAA